MKIHPETRKTLRQRWIGTLYEFASPGLQAIWLKGSGGVVVSCTECMCAYFDDLALDEGLEWAVQYGWLSTAEARATARFHGLAYRYQEPAAGGDRAVLSDPAWCEVVQAAQQAWRELREVLDVPLEQELLGQLEERWGLIPAKT